MTPERWERLKDIFGEALAKDENERDHFLQEACGGDPELIEEARELLRGHALAAELPSSPGVSPSTAGNQPPVFQPEQLAAGRFRIVRFLARGGMGEVYEAEDLVLGQRVALKTIQPGLVREDSLDLLKHEIQSARRVTHANVCRTYDIAEHAEPRIMLLTMELLEGPTLSRHLREHGPFTREQALPLIEQIAAGLQAAHDAGVIHGDFKAGNVILAGKPCSSRPVITDFGLALSPGSRREDAPRAGTPGYMAPELMEGKPATAATDVYALGVAIAGMLGARGTLTSSASPSSAYSPVVEDWGKLGPWRRTVDRCLAADPLARCQSPAAVAAALRKGSRRWVFWAVSAAFLMVSLLALYLLDATSPPGTGFVTRRIVEERAEDMFWDVSLDGGWLAASDWNDGQLVTRDLRTGAVLRRLTRQREPQGSVWNVAVSPNSRHIAYERQWQDGFELRAVNPDGSGDRPLLRDDGIARAVPKVWSADESKLVVYAQWQDRRRGLGLLDAGTGLVTPVSLSPAAQAAGRVLFSPSGNELLFDAPQSATGRLRDVFAVALNGSGERRLIDDPYDDYAVALSPDRARLVFVSDLSGTYGIWTVPIAADLSLGRPEIAMASSGPISPVGLARDGTLYYKIDLDYRKVFVATLDLANRTTLSPPREVGLGAFPSWSRTGELHFASGAASGQPTLMFLAPDTGARPVQVELGGLFRPQWRTNETVVGYGSGQGREGYFEIDVRSGLSRPLPELANLETNFEGAWSADGGVYYNRFRENRRGLFRFDFRTGQREVIFVPPATENMGLENLALSPDGRTLAFQLRTNPNWDPSTLWLLPTDGGDPRPLWTVRKPESFLFGAFTWLPDSQHLLVARSHEPDGESELWLVPVSGNAPERVDFPSVRVRALRLSPDGRTIAYFAGQGELAELRALENFVPER